MTASSSTPSQHPPAGETYRLPRSSNWAKAWQGAAGVAALGALLTVVSSFGDGARTEFSYLFAFMCGLAVALGSIFFILAQHLTGAGWSVSLRRTAEFYASGIWIFAILFAPILIRVVAGSSHLYPWIPFSNEPVAEASSEHGQEHAGEHEHAATAHEGGHDEHHTPQHQAHADAIRAKLAYLAGPGALRGFRGFFAIRALLIFTVLIWIARRYWKTSIAQDSQGGLSGTKHMQRWAPISTILFGLSLTFGAFDWMMSLEPAWFSTIFGVQYFTVGVVSSFATIIVTALLLKESGFVGKAMHIEHFHDVGKLLFGFLVFWAYISFSQYMLIWYAGIPEETTYYHMRWHAGWKLFSVLLLIGHFIFPFFLLMSRNAKRNTDYLKVGAVWLLAMHVLECYWLVMPYANGGELRFHWVDVAALMTVLGSYLAVVFFNMSKHPLVPVGDPRLARALHHEVV